jgi:TolA-binding protein
MNADELYISHIIIVILISIGLGCYCKSNFFSNVTQQDIESLEHDIESLENRLNRQQISQRELLQQQRNIQNLEHIEATPIYSNSSIQTPIARVIRPDTPIYRRPSLTFSESDSEQSSPRVRIHNSNFRS